MTCETARLLIHPYIDGELDLSRSLELEEHLRGCAACAAEVSAVRALSTGIGEAARYYEIPAALEGKIRAMAGKKPSASRVAESVLPSSGWGLIAAAASVAFIVIILKGTFLTGSLTGPRGSGDLAREVVADHVRSLMAGHLTDVISSNQHTVKPWFEGKLDFSPVVEDLSAQGFALVGGRLDYLDGHPVAAIVYRRHAHVINLFVWAQPNATEASLTTTTRDGYNLAHWSDAGMTYWAASSVNLAELREFVADLRKPAAPHAEPSATGG
jgi:anti-sigma factor RsiW